MSFLCDILYNYLNHEGSSQPPEFGGFLLQLDLSQATGMRWDPFIPGIVLVASEHEDTYGVLEDIIGQRDERDDQGWYGEVEECKLWWIKFLFRHSFVI